MTSASIGKQMFCASALALILSVGLALCGRAEPGFKETFKEESLFKSRWRAVGNFGMPEVKEGVACFKEKTVMHSEVAFQAPVEITFHIDMTNGFIEGFCGFSESDASGTILIRRDIFTNNFGFEVVSRGRQSRFDLGFGGSGFHEWTIRWMDDDVITVLFDKKTVFTYNDELPEKEQFIGVSPKALPIMFGVYGRGKIIMDFVEVKPLK